MGQDKDSLNPRSTEYSKSGSDNEAAQTDEAFDPSTTSPEGQQSKQEMKGGTENPLEMSPANQQSSKARDPQEGGADKSPGESTGGRDNEQGRLWQEGWRWKVWLRSS